MNKKVIIYLTLGLLFLAFAFIYKSKQPESKVEYIHNEGKTQGTFYSATYLQPDGIDLQPKIEERLHEFDLSLSTYNPKSIISQINQNVDSVRTDAFFDEMYKMARSVSEKTNGAFDITVAPLVNAWGFGSGDQKRDKDPDLAKILPIIGYQKIKLENNKIIKQNPEIKLDASALAQGLSTDVIARLLEENGCTQYMVEIGGEVMCKGLNPKGEKWKIGIDKPIDDPSNGSQEFQTIVSITNVAINTSGNYRQFYYRDGKKYAHEIDPRSGYPVVHNLLSATVTAPNCMQADAYATAFMILGVDSALQICKSIPDMDCYLIYVDKDGKNQVIYTDGFKKYITN
ncbi:MAG: FAD:protein FMN transferase [Paludibacter sp.]|nr:FAD:protein FMN transferase [Paludibacter sp.]